MRRLVKGGVEFAYRLDRPAQQYIIDLTTSLLHATLWRKYQLYSAGASDDELEKEYMKTQPKTEYIATPLTRSDELAVWALMDDEEQAKKYLNELIDTDYSLRVKRDYTGNSYEAVIYAGKKGKNKAKAINATANNAWAAICCALYKHFILYEGAEWKATVKEGQWLG